MNLAHGTSERVARLALDQGLRPRGKRRSLWKTHPSMADCVYLTSAYALHFARHAMRPKDKTCAIIEIDTQALDLSRLLPDEDVIAQGIHASGRTDWGTNLKSITKNVRNNIEFFRTYTGCDYKWSLNFIGNCSHRGSIAPDLIKRIVILHDAGDFTWTMLHDPMISHMNFKLFAGQYQLTQRWFLGYPITNEEASGFIHPLLWTQNPKHWQEQFEQTNEWIAARREIIKP